MPLPLFLGIAAAVAAAGGIGGGIHGAVKMNDAKDTMNYAEERHGKNMRRFKSTNTKTTKCMDALGEKEIEILSSFDKFSELFEKIHNKPEFGDVVINGNVLPKYNGEELKKVSVGAGALLAGLGGAALGTAGGFAAAGATTAAVMALGTASTGTAIASLSGVAATNATLAALGGGALAAGGGGIALGTTILGAATAGVGLLVGGIIFSIAGSSVSDKADNAYAQMKEAEKQIDQICSYLNELRNTATKYGETLNTVNDIYLSHLRSLEDLVDVQNKTDWLSYTADEQTLVSNTILLVGLLYKMCNVQLVIKSGGENDINKVNHSEIDAMQTTAAAVISEFGIEEEEKEDSIVYSEDAYPIAVIATIVYFARSDGNFSKEEMRVLGSTVNALGKDKELSQSARDAIRDIMAQKSFSFEDLKGYLDNVALEDLLALDNLIDDVVDASDGVTEQEKEARGKYVAYLNQRD